MLPGGDLGTIYRVTCPIKMISFSFWRYFVPAYIKGRTSDLEGEEEAMRGEGWRNDVNVPGNCKYFFGSLSAAIGLYVFHTCFPIDFLSGHANIFCLDRLCNFFILTPILSPMMVLIYVMGRG